MRASRANAESVCSYLIGVVPTDLNLTERSGIVKAHAGLGIAAVVLVSMNLGKIVTAGVNRFGPSLTQTTLTLDSATISPFNGVGTLNRLVVGNPKGWSENPLCSVAKIHIDIVPSSLTGDHIIINEVTIEAPEFNYETKIIASNVNDLLKNIDQALGGKATTMTREIWWKTSTPRWPRRDFPRAWRANWSVAASGSARCSTT